jgi:hypothetical protein
MADLNELEAGQTVKIAGASSSGAETNFVNASSTGELNTADISNNGGVNGALTVGTSSVEAKVGGSPLSNRKTLTVFNNSNSTIYWGYSSGVTTANGSPIFKNQIGTWDIGSNTSVYLIAGSAGNNVRITENA